MPARHDILVGALDFLWRPWGSIEVWEDADHLPPPARPASRRCSCPTTRTCSRPAARTTTPTSTAWEYVRGHEGDPWRTRARPVVGRARPRSPAAPGGVHHAIRHSRTWFRDEDDFPGAAHDGRGRPSGWTGRRRPPRPLPPVRRRVRSARAVRHARAVGVAVRPRLGGPTADLAAVRRRRDRQRRARRARGAPHPGQLRRQAVDDRPLARQGARRDRRARPVGRHRRRRCAPTTATTSASATRSASRACRCTERSATSRCSIAWPGVEPGATDALTTAVDLHATLSDVFGVTPEHRTHGRSLVPLLTGAGDVGPRLGAHRRLGPRASTSSTAGAEYGRAPVRRQRAAVDVVEPVVDDAGPRAPRRCACRGPTAAPRSTPCPARTCR